MIRFDLKNFLFFTLSTCSFAVFAGQARADIDVFDYIQSSYGAGDTTIDIDVAGNSVAVKYLSSYGSGDTSASYNFDTPIGAMEVTAFWNAADEQARLVLDQPVENVSGTFVNLYQQEDSGAAIVSDSTIEKLSGFYINNYADYGGGAICGAEISEISDATFIKNDSFRALGSENNGVIYITSTDKVSNSIFINNTSWGGGVLQNTESIGEFSNNLAYGNTAYVGGVIRGTGDIGKIENNLFVGNYSIDEGGVYFDAARDTVLSKVQNNIFIGNKSSSYGGVLYQRGINSKILEIKENIFLNNAADHDGSYGGDGGVIYSQRDSNEIGNITNNVFIGNTAYRSGGAIYNNGTITEIKNNVFMYNTAGTSGGAIYSTKDLTITSDNGDTIFAYNSANEIPNAIYFGNSYGTLTFDNKNGGNTHMYDSIDGSSGYSVVIRGESAATNTMYLFDDIKNTGLISINGIALNTINSNPHAYDFNNLSVSTPITLAIDINFESETADTISTSSVSIGDGFDGNIVLTSLNILGSMDNLTENTKVQVLKTQENGLKLVLGDTMQGDVYQIGTTDVDLPNDTVTEETSWSDNFYSHNRTDNIYGRLDLATTDTEDDSIGIVYDHTEEGETINTMLGDTLVMVTQANLEERNFNAASANDVYTLGERYEAVTPGVYVSGVGNLASGTMTVNGVRSGDNRSTLDLDNRNGFEVVNRETTLNLNNLNIKNGLSAVVSATAADSVLNLTNVNLTDNIGNNGVIESSGRVNVKTDGANSLFSNTAAENGIYMTGGTLNLSALNSGNLTFDDNIAGENYNINILGDTTGVVRINNLVTGANDVHFYANSVTHLGINADIQANNMIMDSTSAVIRTQAGMNPPLITVDVEVDKDNNTVDIGQIHLDGDITGKYNVLVNSLNEDTLTNRQDAIVPFLFAPNDDKGTDSGFAVARVVGSPYKWEGGVNVNGEADGSTWYLNLNDEEIIEPEVVAALGLHEAAIEQTRSVVRNARNKIAATRGYCPGCGNYSHAWNGEMLRNIWVLAQGETANIEKPADIDADIWGVEAGFDIQNDVNNTLGVFASYRKGEYDLSGKTSRYVRTGGSEIDINSWLGGLYYRYDKNMNWLFATVYGGVQKAKAKTDDGIAKFKTDGIELGASAEIGHTFALNNSLTLDPSLGVFYTQVDFDKAHDNVGKEYDWKTIKHLEAELGAKLTKQFENASVYVKPSVIQTLTGSDSVRVTGLGKADTYHDQTLGRIEIGGDYSFTDALTGYTWANYTFGSSYDAFAGGVGLNYAW